MTADEMKNEIIKFRREHDSVSAMVYSFKSKEELQEGIDNLKILQQRGFVQSYTNLSTKNRFECQIMLR